MPAEKNGVRPANLSHIWGFWASLKLAVFLLLAIAASLAAGTFLESLYDTPTAQYWVYRAFWFRTLLFLLGVNIAVVALSRWPWKKKHAPFLLAHLGILLLLLGSFITDRVGMDGTMRVTEGDTVSTVEFDRSLLVLSDRDSVKTFEVPWLPANAKFNPETIRPAGLPFTLTVDQFLSHADANVSFVADTRASLERAMDVTSANEAPALQVRLTGGPMGISQDFWLWGADPNWSSIQAGPAVLALQTEPQPQAGRPQITFFPQEDGSLKYRAISSEGRKVEGKLLPPHIQGQVLEPGWKGVKLTVREWMPMALAHTSYQLSRTLYGRDAPSSAIHVVAKPSDSSSAASTEVWLGLGDRASLRMGEKAMEIGYFPHRVQLPFSLRLERFQVDRYAGTNDPASYWSRVSVIHEKEGVTSQPVIVRMNEPLTQKGYTFYQASYEDANPRPVTSIFSVNRDPGRPWKYLGSLLIVGGTILLFAGRYRKRKKAA